MSNPYGQVRTEVADGEGSPRTVISAGRAVEQGARSMLLLADGLFRLDVVPQDDTVQTLVRSLDPARQAELRTIPVKSAHEASADTTPLSTARFGGEVVLIDAGGGERAVARVLVASVFHPERGETTFTAQAELLEAAV